MSEIEEKVWQKLDDMQKQLHNVSLVLEKMSGDDRVAAQVLTHWAEKHNNLAKVVEMQQRKIDMLEKWRNYSIGFATAAGVLGSYVYDLLFGKAP